MRSIGFQVTAVWLGLAGLVHGAEPRIELVCVDSEAHGYATFQSHNQKVVSNAKGIFMTHLRTRGDNYQAQQWRLSRSTDRGKSWQTLHESTDPTNPPVIETDEAGNVYLIRPDFVDRNAYLYRFRASDGYRQPLITQIPGASAGKYGMEIDESRQVVYFMAHNGTFNVIGFDGKLKHGGKLLMTGPDAHPQYPHLHLDEAGHLHAAWTNTKKGGRLYWDIHHMYSTDGGKAWRSITAGAIPSPVICDRTGPTLRITLDDEFEVSTWLANFRATTEKLHFLYLAKNDLPRQHYVRYDRATGKREVDRQPVLGGEKTKITGLDGFFAARPNSPTLYLVGKDPKGHLVCLISRDGGDSWEDYAHTKETFNAYSIGGCRKITKDGYLIGSFTDQKGSNAVNDRLSQVYFFRIKAD
jgi:hypothetical protein